LEIVGGGGEWSASPPGRFTPGEKSLSTCWIGGWVDPRAGLDDVEKRKLLTLPGLELRPLSCPAHSQSLYRLRYPGYGNDLNLYSSGDRFEFQLGYMLPYDFSWHSCPFGQMPHYYLNQAKTSSFRIPSNLLFTNHRTIQSHTVRDINSAVTSTSHENRI
jgi:hypothetical protein